MLNLQALLTPYAMPNPTAAVQGASQSLGDVADFKEGRRKDIQHQAQQQGEFDQTHALQQQEQDYSEHKDTRDYNQKREDEYNALDEAYRHAQAQDPKQADEIYGPIFKDRGYAERRNPSPEAAPGEDIKRDVPVGEPKPIPVEPAPTSPSNGALPGESASSYMSRRQATPEEPEAKPEPVEPKNEDEALAQLEAAQKEADLKQAAPEAAPAEGVPSAAQMTAPPPKTAAPMDAKPADVAPAQAAPPAGMVQTGSSTRTKGMTGETPEGPGPEVGPLAKDQPVLESPGFEMTSPMGRQAHFGAQPGQGQEAQRQLQQDAYAFVSKIPDPKIRAFAGASLAGGTVNGDIRTPAQLAHFKDEIMGLMKTGMQADAGMFSALHRPAQGGGARTDPLNWKAGFDTAKAYGTQAGVVETDNSLEDVREARDALSAGDYSSTLGAAYKIAHGRDPHAVVTNKDLENALGSTGLDKIKDWLTTNDPSRVPDLNEVEKSRLFKVVDGLEKVASINMRRKYEKFRRIPKTIPNGEMKDGFDAYVQSQFGGFDWYQGTQSGRPDGAPPVKPKGPPPTDAAVDDLVKGVKK